MLLVFFPRPLQFDRRAGKGHGDLDGLMHIVTGAATAKAAAQNSLINLTLIQGQS